MKSILLKELKKAMKEKNADRKGTLQLTIAGIDSAQRDKGEELTSIEEIGVIRKEIKQISQTIDGAKKANRQDIIERETAKINYLAGFLPEEMSNEDVYRELIGLGLHYGMNMGEAMKIARKALNGAVDNSTIAKVVKKIITKEIE